MQEYTLSRDQGVDLDVMNLSSGNVFKERKEVKISGELALRLVSSRFYVKKGSKASDVLRDFQRHPFVPAVGVVDEEERVVGVLVREKFLGFMTQPFLQDVYYHRSVESLVQKASVYFYQTHIYSLAEELSHVLDTREESFFVLKDEKDRFMGIFSTTDLLIYLSKIMQKDIRSAHEVQQNLVPAEHIYSRPMFHLFGASQAAKEVGGDFYAWKEMEKGVVFTLCDVSGKGPSASLITTSLSGMFQAFDFSHKPMQEFLFLLNRYLFSAFHGEKYLTGMFGIFREDTGVCMLWDMGHGHVFLKRKGMLTKPQLLDDNVPLGLFESLTGKHHRIQLHDGDMLVVFSDGLVEQKNTTGEFYGEKRLYRIVKGTTNPRLMKDALWADVKNFRGKYPQSDDISFLLLQYHPQGE